MLGHKRRNPEPAVLPTSDAERQGFHRDHSLASDFDRKIEELDAHFDKVILCNFHISHIRSQKEYYFFILFQNFNRFLVIIFLSSQFGEL